MSKATVQSLIACLPHAVLLLDGDATIVAHNEAAAALLGARDGALVGCSLARLLLPGAAECLRQIANTAAADPHPRREEWTLRTQAGTEVRATLTFGRVVEDASSWMVVSIDPSQEPPAPDVRTMAEQRLRELTWLLPTLIWTALPDGSCDMLNHRWAEFTGIPVEEQLGWGWARQLHPDDVESVTAASLEATRTGGVYSSEFRLRRHDGVYRWFVTRAVPLRDERGEIEKWVGANTEIHEARELRERLLVEQERLASILEHPPVVVISLARDTDGSMHCTYASAGARALYGFSPEEIYRDGEIAFALVHPDDLDALKAALERSAHEHALFIVEYRYLHPERGEIWHEARSMPRFSPDGRVLWAGVVSDVTSRKLAEDELMLTRAQLESALQSAEMGAWIWDPESGLLWGSESQRALWEVPPETPAWFDAQMIGALMHPDDVANVRAKAAEAIASGSRLEADFRILVPGGGERWITTRAQVNKDAQGRTLRVAGINLDITKQKLASEAALRSQKLEALGTLAGGIAHDFNNLLFAIGGNARLALGAAREETRPMLEEILSASRRATELVRQILEFSRPQERQQEVIRLSEPVEEALRLVRATIPAMTQIRAELSADAPSVLFDAARVVQVVVNLCANAAYAIKQTKRQGTITVRLEGVAVRGAQTQPPLGRYALLTIADDGCGMDEATKARIYDPFFTTKPQGEGTGLGLSVVHGIVQAADGHLLVDSKPGQGTVFRLYVPAVNGAPAEAQVASAPRSRGDGKRVLFVDDEQMLVTLGRAYLTRLGYQAEAFQDPHAALTAFCAHPEAFDVAVTDVSMPTLSGFDLVRGLRAIRGDLPVLMMSGYLGMEERKLARQLGVSHIVLKPLDMDELADILTTLTSPSNSVPARR